MERVLLLLMPYWAPIVPPSGLSCIKGYLKQHEPGLYVKTVDANLELELRQIYDEYFHYLRQIVPEDKHSVFYNIGNEVWQNHMTAHLNVISESQYSQYTELVKLLVYNTFFCHINNEQVAELTRLITAVYERLERYLTHLIELEKPTVIGISVYIATVGASLFAFRMIRKRYPGIRTVMGGGIFNGLLSPGSPNLEYFLGRTTDCIDHVIIGEGEKSFLRLLRGEIPASQRVISLHDACGSVLDLSQTAPPDMSDFNLDFYPYATAYASRSCPFQCSFCSDPVFWGRYRKKKAQQVAEELKAAYRQYGSQVFVMSDLLLNPIAADLAAELIASGVSLYWDTHFRIGPEINDTSKTVLLRKGGCYRVQLGTESGSQRMLDLMGKKITTDQIKTAVSALAHAGIKTTTYWVIGHPGETEADFQQTLDLIEELKNDIYQAETNPFWYVPNGQVAEDKWRPLCKPLYPDWARDLLIIQQWYVDLPPGREERYDRVNRFAQHCKKIGVPNPYSTHEIHLADIRWKKFHKNAVPALEEFKGKGVYITENLSVREINPVLQIAQHDDNWGF